MREILTPPRCCELGLRSPVTDFRITPCLRMTVAARYASARKTCRDRTFGGYMGCSSRRTVRLGSETSLLTLWNRRDESGTELAPGAKGSWGYRIESDFKALIHGLRVAGSSFPGPLYSFQEVVMQLISAKSLRALMLVILVALVGSGVLVYGQGTSGSLTGQVSDPSGAAVANATVSLKNVDTDYLQTATSNNCWSLPAQAGDARQLHADHRRKRLCRVRAERHRHYGQPLTPPRTCSSSWPRPLMKRSS